MQTSLVQVEQILNVVAQRDARVLALTNELAAARSEAHHVTTDKAALAAQVGGGDLSLLEWLLGSVLAGELSSSGSVLQSNGG